MLRVVRIGQEVEGESWKLSSVLRQVLVDVHKEPGHAWHLGGDGDDVRAVLLVFKPERVVGGHKLSLVMGVLLDQLQARREM